MTIQFVDFHINSMVSFPSYASLPEARSKKQMPYDPTVNSFLGNVNGE